MSASPSMGAHAPTGKPFCEKNAFSRRRSCAIATEAPAGRTTVLAAIASSASAGAFSNSVVTAAQVRASSSSAARSAYAAERWAVANSAAGACASGSSTVTR
jgi:hypothetical protein